MIYHNTMQFSNHEGSILEFTNKLNVANSYLKWIIHKCNISQLTRIFNSVLKKNNNHSGVKGFGGLDFPKLVSTKRIVLWSLRITYFAMGKFGLIWKFYRETEPNDNIIFS